MRTTAFICRVLCAMMIILTAGTMLSHAVESRTPAQVLVEYHDALKNGDARKLLDCLGGDFHARYRGLFDRDAGYPEFIKNYYEGTTLTIRNEIVDRSDAVVEVQIRFANGNTSISKFDLRKSENDQWLITRQYLE